MEGVDDMSKERFEELEKKAQQAGSLKELFEYWKEAQIEESKESCETTFPRGKEFEELYGAEFKKSFKCDGKLNCDVEKTESLNVPILFVCKESNASDEIERMLSSYALHQKAYKELNAREKMESKEGGTNFWMQDVIRWKLYHEAPQGRAGSKYYNCLRTLVKNAQNAIGSCELIDCAYMNINKRGGYNTADKTRIRNYAKKYEKFIEKEIELLDPEIIICCGILDDQGICKKILKSCGKSVYLYKRHPSRYSKDLCNWEKLEEL